VRKPHEWIAELNLELFEGMDAAESSDEDTLREPT